MKEFLSKNFSIVFGALSPTSLESWVFLRNNNILFFKESEFDKSNKKPFSPSFKISLCPLILEARTSFLENINSKTPIGGLLTAATCPSHSEVIAAASKPNH